MTLDLHAIKARLAAATPGTWTWEPTASGPIREWSGTCLVLTSQENGPRARLIGTVSGENDARLIAHAPSDMAALVSEVERLRAENTMLIVEAEDLRSAIFRACEQLSEAADAR